MQISRRREHLIKILTCSHVLGFMQGSGFYFYATIEYMVQATLFSCWLSVPLSLPFSLVEAYDVFEAFLEDCSVHPTVL